MATFYADEASIYKCPRHPSKRRRTGVCPACLKERLSALCPDCATPRPCSCCSSSTSSSSSSSSNSSYTISSLISSEPPFRRSVSAAPAFPRFDKKQKLPPTEPPKSSTKSTKTSSFWAVLWPRKAKKDCHKVGGEGGEERASLRRSRTVAAGSELRSSRAAAAAAVKWKIWYFPSPMKVFKQSKVAKVVLNNERSPLHRG